ncbi:apoptosis facilitator Bcl-2-like protein 14 [Leucoraja erinacea]|uniref:apoptosis facilitator Bcl-2-like protein 14 n=1 Tax=Leucoraja erinaceus TaxID=7782 RepID=UPI002458C4BF|nr:apoptosis facilitator Bcl-2-like protein 14 [Leucoraja erinacea]
MAENSKRSPEERHSRKVLKSETQLVIEAFLRRVQNEGGSVGHVGRCYHDSRKFKAKTPDSQDGNIIYPIRQPKSSHKGSLEREDEEKGRSMKHLQEHEEGAVWGTSDEEICRAEEKKHGFKTAIKKLIKRQKSKKRSEKTKVSQEFLDGDRTVVKSSRSNSKSNSLKRQKSMRPSIDCLVGQPEPLPSDMEDIGKQKMSGQQKFLNFFRKGTKKSDNAHSKKSQTSPPTSPRPTTLALNLHTPDLEPLEFYSEVAKKLDQLAQEYCSHTGGDQQTPVIQHAPSQGIIDPHTIKEKEIGRIVMMLQEQGDEINEKMKDDPLLQRPMSYRSFTRLVEVFTASVEGQITDPATSPELTKIALTMELTRRVAGISSHPVQQLMGYSMDYIDMFVPWLQQQGGWETVLHSDDVSDHQID